MINPKTGTTWAPDIRPEAIETFRETYTPEGGEEQTVTYKRVADHPILNGIQDIKAFFTTHVGAVWYNLSERKTLLDKLNEQDEEIKMGTLKYVDSGSFSITTGDTRYALVPAEQVPGTRNYLFATVKTWSASGTVFSIAGHNRNFYVIGEPNKSVNGLQLRFWYMNDK